jgi:hypothetical protein
VKTAPTPRDRLLELRMQVVVLVVIGGARRYMPQVLRWKRSQ